MSLSVSLFSVFPIASHVSQTIPGRVCIRDDLNDAHLIRLGAAETASEEDCEQRHHFRDYPPPPNRAGFVQLEQSNLEYRRNNTIIGSLPDVVRLNRVVQPSDHYFLFINSKQERQLMHYWMAFLSGLMTPTPTF